MATTSPLVRRATADDLGFVNDLYNHYVRESHATFDVEPKDLAWRQRWFEGTTTTDIPYPWPSEPEGCSGSRQAASIDRIPPTA